MPRILLCEDEVDWARALHYRLERAGHQVTHVTTAREAIRHVAAAPPDLLLLDWNLPDLPGTEVLRSLRDAPATAAIPVIMLTARDEEVDRVVGFELGAEDYVVKPVSPRELELRIDALLRRCMAPRAAVVFKAGGLHVDPAREDFRLDGAPLALAATEQAILCALARADDRPLSRGALVRAVHGDSVAVTERVVDQWVLRLRERLGAAAVHLETVRGVGYRLTATPAGR
jgi:two-component system phosphate regulon response regulator PhoB